MGVGAFVYPFLMPRLEQIGSEVRLGGQSEAVNAPIITAVLISVSLLILLLQAQGEVLNVKVVASLGVLVAITSSLRFLENALPGPGGFSPVFVPIIICGYVFGSRYGLLMGSLTMFTSAVITGGIGPWLPFQMYLAAWVGLTAGWLPKLGQGRIELLLLAGFSFVWGFIFGIALNLYFWPFLAGDSLTTWQPGITLWEAVGRYSAFYLGTSLLWDLLRAIGNVVLVFALGRPTLRALERFKRRFNFRTI